MKKVRNILLAALVLLTVLSLYSVSGTYAKYTTSGGSADTARVAKFGVTITGAKDEDYTTANNTLFKKGDGSLISATDVLVAPNTNGDMTNFTISGTPEVAVKVKYEGELKLEGDWKDKDGNDYMPLIFTINNTDYYIGMDSSVSDIDQLKNKVAEVIGSYSKAYAAGTDLSTKNDEYLTISYRWLYEAPEDLTATNLEGLTQSNENDTKLGDRAVDGDLKVTLSVTATVEQITSLS